MATYTVTIDGLTGIDAFSVSLFEDVGFTVSGDTATRQVSTTDAEFWLPDLLMKPGGGEFYGYYIDDPDLADPMVVIDPSTLSGDVTYHTVFYVWHSVRFYSNGTEIISLRTSYNDVQTGFTIVDVPGAPEGSCWRLRGTPIIVTPGYVMLSRLGLDDPSEYRDLEFDAVEPPIYALTLTGLTGIDAASVSSLRGLGFEVINGTASRLYSADEAPFYLPSVSKDGYMLLGWYTTGGDVQSRILFDPTAAVNASYTADFISSELTIAREVAKLRANLAAAYGAIAAKGGTVPADKTAYNLTSAIFSIS